MFGKFSPILDILFYSHNATSVNLQYNRTSLIAQLVQNYSEKYSASTENFVIKSTIIFGAK